MTRHGAHGYGYHGWEAQRIRQNVTDSTKFIETRSARALLAAPLAA